MPQIKTPAEAEAMAADHMQRLGFSDAANTGGGTDGGIDVQASGAVAQVKFHMKPTGRPDAQKLFGARGNDTGKKLLFYAFNGYSAMAKEYANSVDMALFQFDWQGTVSAVNDAALNLQSPPAATPPPPPPMHYSPPSSLPGSSSEPVVSPSDDAYLAALPRSPRPGGRAERTVERNDKHRQRKQAQREVRNKAALENTNRLIADLDALDYPAMLDRATEPCKKRVLDDQLDEYLEARRKQEFPETEQPNLRVESALLRPVFDSLPAPISAATLTPMLECVTNPKQSVPPIREQPRVDLGIDKQTMMARKIFVPIFAVFAIVTLITVFVSGLYSMAVLPLMGIVATIVTYRYSFGLERIEKDS